MLRNIPRVHSNKPVLRPVVAYFNNIPDEGFVSVIQSLLDREEVGYGPCEVEFPDKDDPDGRFEGVKFYLLTDEVIIPEKLFWYCVTTACKTQAIRCPEMLPDITALLERVPITQPKRSQPSKIFGDFDVSGFWEQSDYADQEYVGEAVTDDLVKSIEDELGYKLPKAYVELMKSQNGGLPKKTNHRTKEPTSWAEDHVAITGIYGIDRNQHYSLVGSTGSKFWIEEWGYPPIGVYFADCPSAGHDMLCLDYRDCGPDGEPQVVHVDQESDYKITFVAKNFETFIRGLQGDEEFED